MIPINPYLCIILTLLTLVIGFWAVMLMDCLKRHELEFHTNMPNPKRMWTILLIVGIPWCAVVYFIAVKRKD